MSMFPKYLSRAMALFAIGSLLFACEAELDSPALTGSGEIEQFVLALTSPPQAPFASNLGSLSPSQCFNGSYSHKAPLQYGIDYVFPIGTPILAVGGGTVAYVHDGCVNNTSSCKNSGAAACTCFHGIGNVVVVDHGGGDYALYAHLNKGTIAVTVGQQVCAGLVLGQSGWSGFGTAPHLHFQMQSTAGGDVLLVNGYVSKSFGGWYGPNGTQSACGSLTSYNTAVSSCSASLAVNQSTSGSVAKGATKVYSFTKSAGKTYSIKLHPTSGDPDLYTHHDSAVGTGNYQFYSNNGASSDDTVGFTANATGAYYVLVSGWSSASYTLTVTESGGGSGSGSGCALAGTVPAAGGTVTGTTSGGSNYTGTCGNSGSAPERVYAWTPSASGTAKISVNGFDAVLYVRSSSCSGGQIICKDSYGSTGTETVSIAVSANQTYYIFVDGYSSSKGAFSLSVTAPGSSGGNSGSCASPLTLSSDGGTVTGTTSGSGSMSGSCGNSGSSGEKVIAWTPAASGSASVSVSGYDVVFYVRNGSCSGGSQLLCKDQSGSSGTETATFSVSAGNTVYLVVDGYAGQNGTFSLTVTAPTSTGGGSSAGVPTTPTGLTPGGPISACTGVYGSNVGLDWNSSGGASSYQVTKLRWNASAAGWVSAGTSAVGGSYSTFALPVSGAFYIWKVRACNSAGCSANAGWKCFKHVQ